MDALAMIPPGDRTVRAKLQLFLRLWMSRQKYENLRPFGETSARRVRFHLEQLRACWDHVVEFQRALGLDVMHFTPKEKFEYIYVITAFVDRELRQRENTLIDIQARWAAYQHALSKLSYQLNPYDFTDACTRCYKLILELSLPPAPDVAEVIPMPSPKNGVLPAAQRLRMKDDPDEDQSCSGLSRYSPGGRFSYARK